MRSHCGICGTNCMPIALVAIIVQLSHLIRRGMAPRWRHCTMGGPNRRWFSNQISKAGQPLLAAQADAMRKGTVGTTGRWAEDAAAPHLHYEVKIGNQSIDPEQLETGEGGFFAF